MFLLFKIFYKYQRAHFLIRFDNLSLLLKYLNLRPHFLAERPMVHIGLSFLEEPEMSPPDYSDYAAVSTERWFQGPVPCPPPPPKKR
jgi:hypothetical protein